MQSVLYDWSEPASLPSLAVSEQKECFQTASAAEGPTVPLLSWPLPGLHDQEQIVLLIILYEVTVYFQLMLQKTKTKVNRRLIKYQLTLQVY